MSSALPGAPIARTHEQLHGPSLNKDVQRGVHDRFRPLPIWRPATLVDLLLADAVRYTSASGVILALGQVLGFRPEARFIGVAAAVALLLAFAFSLSWLWMLVGLIPRSENAVFATGWLQAFVNVNPITLVVTAVRGLVHGQPLAGEIAAVLAISAALVAVFGPLMMRRHRRKV